MGGFLSWEWHSSNYLIFAAIIIIILGFINRVRERNREINVFEITEQEMKKKKKARKRRPHHVCKKWMVCDGMNRAVTCKGLGEFQRMIEKRKFPMLAIRGYCGPRNFGYYWAWPEFGWVKRSQRILAQVFTIERGGSTLHIISTNAFPPAPQGDGTASQYHLLQSCEREGWTAGHCPIWAWTECDLGTKAKRQKQRHSDAGCCSQC